MEHIIPQGLGGTMELPKSSCPECAKTTGQVEQSCLREMFGAVRYSMGLSPRKRKKKPQDITVTVVNHDDSLEIKRVELEVHPHSFILFTFGPPDILLGGPVVLGGRPREVFTTGPGVWSYLPNKSDAQHPLRYGGKGFKVGSFQPMLFSRMLAKIAHAFAVADQGQDSFTPYLPALILGNYETPSYLVGGEAMIPPPFNALHRLHLYCRRVPPSPELLIVDIRLFANFGAPIYRVVVGRWLGKPSPPTS
jgi:hypothetical protein